MHVVRYGPVNRAGVYAHNAVTQAPDRLSAVTANIRLDPAHIYSANNDAARQTAMLLSRQVEGFVKDLANHVDGYESRFTDEVRLLDFLRSHGHRTLGDVLANIKDKRLPQRENHIGASVSQFVLDTNPYASKFYDYIGQTLDRLQENTRGLVVANEADIIVLTNEYNRRVTEDRPRAHVTSGHFPFSGLEFTLEEREVSLVRIQPSFTFMESDGDYM